MYYSWNEIDKQNTLKVNILDQNIVVDLLLWMKEEIMQMFGCTGSYRIQMYKEQTNFLLSISDLIDYKTFHQLNNSWLIRISIINKEIKYINNYIQNSFIKYN